MDMPSEQIHEHVGHTRFIDLYLVTMRPYLMFVSGITGIVGMSVVESIPSVKALLIATASFLSYGFGQALTDCFQIDTDSISSPYRPLTQGRISGRAVMVVSLLGLCFCVAILSIETPINLALGIAAGSGLATYTTFKRRWWAGPLYNAWIVVVLCLMGFEAASSHPYGNIPITAIYIFATVFFAYANFVLAGYFKDIAADRATGYRTLPVVFGRTVAACVSDLFATLGVVATLLFLHTLYGNRAFSPVDSISLIFILSAGIMAIVGQVRLHRVVTDGEAHRAISPVLHGYVLVLAGVAGLNQPNWSVALIAFYGAFIFTLRLRPEKSQL